MHLLRTAAIAAALLPAALLPAGAGAQTVSSPLTPYTLTSTTYTQDFDGLAGSTSAGIAGWQRVETGSNANATYGVSNGSGTNLAGNVYSFGATGSSDRALGSVGSGSLTTARFGGIFTNGLGSAIEALTFNYTGEQWRLANSTDDGLFFSYSLDATSLTTGTWIAVSALDFLPVRTNGTGAGAALDGNLAVNQRLLGATIPGLSIASGGTFGFRWTDLNSGGSDHGLAIDNLSITATLPTAAVPEPATWALMILGFGAVGGALRRRARPVLA